MEGCFTEEKRVLSRVEIDRYLRTYRQMNGILHSSKTFARCNREVCDLDETAIKAQMYSLRALILSIEDVRCRMLLYHYYIKGYTLKQCERVLGISKRSVYRLKIRALEAVAEQLKKSKN